MRAFAAVFIVTALLHGNTAEARYRPPQLTASNCVVTRIQDGHAPCQASNQNSCMPVLAGYAPHMKRVSFSCDGGPLDLWFAAAGTGSSMPAYGETLHAQLFASRNLGRPLHRLTYVVVRRDVSACGEFMFFNNEDLLDDCLDRNAFWEVLPGMQDFNVAIGFAQ